MKEDNTFKNQQEIFGYLINGGKVRNIKNGIICYFIDNKLNCHRYFSITENWVKHDYPQWYENITKPVLCWVSDKDQFDKLSVARIIERGSDRLYKDTEGMYWDCATPVTDEEKAEL